MEKIRVSGAVSEGLKAVFTPGGSYEVRWNDQAAVTPFGQMAFFIEFLNLSGLLESWVQDCPLTYLSPNAPTKRDLLGTWLLSVLAGHKRYSHVTSIHSDGVNPELLGMNKVVSEDALRRGLEKIPEEAGLAWLQDHLGRSVLPLLKAPWIMDIDTTVKVLYGKQEGAEVGYNPKKPGRPHTPTIRILWQGYAWYWTQRFCRATRDTRITLCRVFAGFWTRFLVSRDPIWSGATVALATIRLSRNWRIVGRIIFLSSVRLPG